jgi:quinol monooxygenase YgiN
MVILRQRMRSKPDKCDDVMAALVAIVTPARATPGVISLDIARDLLEPDAFIATRIYEDGAALERQESAPDVHRAMAMFARCSRTRSQRRPIERSMTPRSIPPLSEFAGAASDAIWVAASPDAARMRPQMACAARPASC